MNFHELRRTEALKCKPHTGHEIIKGIEEEKPSSTVITQNIDGMHQRANSVNVLELHGSLWRMRCETEKKVFSKVFTANEGYHYFNKGDAKLINTKVLEGYPKNVKQGKDDTLFATSDGIVKFENFTRNGKAKKRVTVIQ